MPFVDTSAMNAHFAEVARTVAEGPRGSRSRRSGWHGAPALIVPDSISLVVLAPYSPELNPVANVWHYLRAN
jgi:hypothetical protein